MSAPNQRDYTNIFAWKMAVILYRNALSDHLTPEEMRFLEAVPRELERQQANTLLLAEMKARPFPPPADPWVSIDRAPRDGTLVDLWVSGKRIADCYWSFARNDKGERVDDPWDGWCCDVGKPGPSGFNPYPNRITGAPTHYMPIPAGPAT